MKSRATDRFRKLQPVTCGVRVWAWALVMMLGVVSCGEERQAASARPKAEDEGFEVGAVHYWLQIDRDQTREQGQRLIIVNDRGIAFTLQEATISNFSASLLPCRTAVPTEQARTGQGAWLRRALLPFAHAGHSSVRDPSEVNDTRREDLLRAPMLSSFGEREFPPARYCRVHYLMAAKNRDPSLQLKAQYVADNVSYELRIDTRLANGAFKELANVASGQGNRADVTITRSLRHLFDGIEPRSDGEKNVIRAVLRNLLDRTRIAVKFR